MVDLLFCLYYLGLLLFDFPLLCYYINLRSSVILCLFFGDIHLSLGISLSGSIFFASILTASELFFSDVIRTFGDFNSNFIANQITSCFCCFLNCSFRGSSKCISSRMFGMIKTFLTVFTVYVFTDILIIVFAHIFSNRQKRIIFYKIPSSRSVHLNSVLFFVFYTLVNN